MNTNIAQLYAIAQKQERIIIGLMSGTSVDGLDIAVCKISGSGVHTKVEVQQFETITYNQTFKDNVAAIFSKKNVDLEAVCLINEWIGAQHGTMINEALKKWQLTAADIDIIASHGQTIYHAPQWLHQNQNFGNATLQIGDGDHIAVTTGIITISDFRQKHIAAGGEGAPLAVYGDYLIFGKKDENRIMLNIGGIANFTFLPANMNVNEVFSTDVGTGNTIMDAYCKQYFNCNFDANGKIAASGTVNALLLNQLKSHPFFDAALPKTTGPELFNLTYLATAQNQTNTNHISKEDVMATLNKFSADGIIDAIKKSIETTKELKIYSSGGGMHNPIMMQHIKEALPEAQFFTTADLAINPDAKEAVLFALLANETLVGNNSINSTKKEIPNISMGKISFAR